MKEYVDMDTECMEFFVYEYLLLSRYGAVYGIRNTSLQKKSAYQTRCGVGDLRVVRFPSRQQNMMDSARSVHQQRTPAVHAVLLKGAFHHHHHHFLWRYTHTTHAILTAILNITDLSSLHIRSHDAVL